MIDAERTQRTVALVVDVSQGATRLAIAHPGACPVEASLDEREVMLVPFLRAPEGLGQVGYDADFAITIEPGCREAIAGRITWSEPGASAPLELRAQRNGFVVRGHTAPLLLEPPSRGVVPISQDERALHVLVGRWEGSAHAPRELRVEVASAVRTTGMPSLGAGARVLLAGGPYTLTDRPAESSAALVETIEARTADGAPFPLAALTLDRDGAFVLASSTSTLTLRAGGHATTPLDCGRSECHQAAALGAEANPMTHVLARYLASAMESPECALACHAVGEPGLPDRGFTHVARELDFDLGTLGARDHDELPRALRRLSGVGCTACHGPGAIPEPGAGWTILRSDVCATCHDAPPRYGHVRALAGAAMSRSDLDPSTRSGGCARCHTTEGFLASIGARTSTEHVPADATLGISCAACHAPHREGSLASLVRAALPDATLGSPSPSVARSPSSICIGCHAPGDQTLPSASASAIVLGRGARSATGTAVHADVDGLCLACHRGEPIEGTLGTSHSFAAGPSACTPCHDAPPPRDPSIRARAMALAAALGVTTDGAHAAATIPSDAAWNVALVLLDPAADVHGPDYARALLDTAEGAR